MKCCKYWAYYILLLLLLLSGCSIGIKDSSWSEPDEAKTLSRIQDAAQLHKIPVVATVVLNQGQAMYYSYPATPDTLNRDYGLASVSKSILAATTIEWAEHNKIKRDDLIVVRAKEVKSASILNDITLEQLLNHRSGVFEFRTSERIEPPIYRQILPPDTYRKYCNWNYSVIFEFLKSQNAKRHISDIIDDFIPIDISQPSNTETLSVPLGAGGLEISTKDYAGFINWILEPAQYQTLTEVMKTSEKAELRLYQMPDISSRYESYPVYFQTGKDLNTTAFLFLCPELQWGCGLLADGNFDSAFIEKCLAILLKTHFPKPLFVRLIEPQLSLADMNGRYEQWLGEKYIDIEIENGVLKSYVSKYDEVWEMDRVLENTFRQKSLSDQSILQRTILLDSDNEFYFISEDQEILGLIFNNEYYIYQ